MLCRSAGSGPGSAEHLSRVIPRPCRDRCSESQRVRGPDGQRGRCFCRDESQNLTPDLTPDGVILEETLWTGCHGSRVFSEPGGTPKYAKNCPNNLKITVSAVQFCPWAPQQPTTPPPRGFWIFSDVLSGARRALPRRRNEEVTCRSTAAIRVRFTPRGNRSADGTPRRRDAGGASAGSRGA